LPLVFVSHAAADQEIATAFKIDVESAFLKMCEVFVSSNLDSISAGSEWVSNIKSNIEKADILIGLISPLAITRPWVFFEFGAAWIRAIPAIPICHSGFSRNSLAPPISIFQALDLTDSLHLEHVFGKIAQSIGCTKPAIDYAALSVRYKDITEIRRINRYMKESINSIIHMNPEFNELINGNKESIDILIHPQQDFQLQEFFNECRKKNFADIKAHGFAMGTRIGAQANIYKLEKLSEFDSVLNSLSVE
jgi:TIR domain